MMATTTLNKRRSTTKEAPVDESSQQDTGSIKSRVNPRRRPDRTASILIVGFCLVAVTIFYAGARTGSSRRNDVRNDHDNANGIRRGGFMRSKHEKKQKHHLGHHHDDHNSISTHVQQDEDTSSQAEQEESAGGKPAGSQCKYASIESDGTVNHITRLSYLALVRLKI